MPEQEQKFVVVENGQRASLDMVKSDAEAEATRRKQRIAEESAQAPAAAKPQPIVEVKQVLHG